MFSLFCGPSKSRHRKKSNSFTSQCSVHSSDSETSSCYHSPHLEKEPRSGVNCHSKNSNNKTKSCETVSKESVVNPASLSSQSVLDLKDFLTKSNPVGVENNSTQLSTRSILDLHDNKITNGGNVFQLSDEYEDIGSTSNLSIIDRINKLTGNHINHTKNSRNNSRFRSRPKSMTSSFKNLTSSAAGDRSPLKRTHSVRFKGATIREDKIFEEIDEEDEESTFNIFDKLLFLDYNNNNKLGVVGTKCKLRRTRSGVSSSSSRRSLGSATNLSAVEKLSVSSINKRYDTCLDYLVKKVVRYLKKIGLFVLILTRFWSNKNLTVETQTLEVPQNNTEKILLATYKEGT